MPEDPGFGSHAIWACRWNRLRRQRSLRDSVHEEDFTLLIEDDHTVFDVGDNGFQFAAF